MKTRRALIAVAALAVLAQVALSAPVEELAPDSAIMVFAFPGPQDLGEKVIGFSQSAGLPMLAGMFNQVAVTEAITGTAEGTGVALSGRPFVFAILDPNEFGDPAVGFLPVTDFDAFVQGLGAAKGEGGVYESDAGGGPTCFAKWRDYAVGAEDERCLKAVLDDLKAGRTIAGCLTPREKSFLSAGDLVLYVPLASIMETYETDINDALEGMGMMTAAMPGMVGEIFEAEMDLAMALARQTQGVAAQVTLEPDGVMVRCLATMKPGSEAASVLSEADADLDIVQHLSAEEAFFMGAFTTGGEATRRLAKAFGDLLTESSAAGTEDTKAKLAEQMDAMLEMFDGPCAFSVGLGASDNGFFAADYVYYVPDAAAARASMNEYMRDDGPGTVWALLREIWGLNMSTTVTEDAQRYSGWPIDAIDMTMDFASGGTGEEGETALPFAGPQGEMLAKIYGDPMQIRVAHAGKWIVMVLGGDVDTRIRGLIDSVRSGTRAPEMVEMYKAAQQKFPEPKVGLMVMAMDKYLAGIGSLLAEMEPQAAQMFTALAAIGEVPPVVMSVSTHKGAASTGLFVPNDLIAKMSGAFMQMMMMQGMQQGGATQ